MIEGSGKQTVLQAHAAALPESSPEKQGHTPSGYSVVRHTLTAALPLLVVVVLHLFMLFLMF